jgi:hypothetical protein
MTDDKTPFSFNPPLEHRLAEIKQAVQELVEMLDDDLKSNQANMRESKKSGTNCPGFNQDMGARDALAVVCESRELEKLKQLTGVE